MTDDITDLQRRAVEARDKNEVLDLGTCKVQKNGESLYVVLHSLPAGWEGIEPGTVMKAGFDLGGGTFLFTEADVDDQDVRAEQLAEG